MREFSTPLSCPVPESGNLTDPLVTHASHRPDLPLFVRPGAAGWETVTAGVFCQEVRAVAGGLLAAGVGVGDRVVLMSETSYQWALCDYAIWFAGAVGVPIYPTATGDQLRWLLERSDAQVALVGGVELARTVSVASPGLAVQDVSDAGLGALIGAGRGRDDEVERRRASRAGDDLATVVFTSGTTGAPKGCRLTHKNLMFESATLRHELAEVFTAAEGQAATLLFLPLAHLFARVLQITCVDHGVVVRHHADIGDLPAALAEFSPTFLTCVPRALELVVNQLAQESTADGRGRSFDRAVRAVIDYSRSLDAAGPRPWPRVRHRLVAGHVRAGLRQRLGGRCRFAISGGAPLGERLGHFYRGAGVTVLEGYGLTETCATTTTNAPGAVRVGTVGRPLPGTAVRVADDGELLVRGPHVFAGYWHDQPATDQVFAAGGWLRTGDLGEVDEEGFVRINGRRDEILVTAGGKHVSPSLLEERVRACPLVAECLVVGAGQPYLGALITLDPDSLPPAPAGRRGRRRLRDLVTDPGVVAEVQQAVDRANEAVSKAEAIRRFLILPDEWSEEDGQLTPSLKVRRAHVRRHYRAEIDALFLP